MRIVNLLMTVLAVAVGPEAIAVMAQQTPEQYITRWKEVAVKKMAEHGIPASITLAQGLLESGNGNSVLATEGNNHFGIKCTPNWTGGKMYHDDDKKDDCFRKYKDASQSFEDHSDFLLRPRYASLFQLKPTDYKGWAHGLKKCGYATDPQYPQKLITLIERYQLDQFDKGVDVQYPGTAKAPSIRKPSRKRANEDNTVTIGTARPVELFDGRIKYVRAKRGETVRDIANEIEQMPGMVAGWNDVDKNATFKEGEVVYIQPKSSKSKTLESCVAEDGETLWSISQRYGVKLKKLAKYNDMVASDPVKAGQKVWLRKHK